MEVLFEYHGSRRQLNIGDGENLTRLASSELQRMGKRRAQVFTAGDDLPVSGGREETTPDVYLLQKWSEQWECYVDVVHCNEVHDGERLTVIAKPKPSSKLYWLCCCVGDRSYRVGKVGGSGKKRIPKTEEIQSLEYRFRVESEANSEWEETHSAAPSDTNPHESKEGESYIRAETGRASWKLIENVKTGESVEEMESYNEHTLQQREGQSSEQSSELLLENRSEREEEHGESLNSEVAEEEQKNHSPADESTEIDNVKVTDSEGVTLSDPQATSDDLHDTSSSEQDQKQEASRSEEESAVSLPSEEGEKKSHEEGSLSHGDDEANVETGGGTNESTSAGDQGEKNGAATGEDEGEKKGAGEDDGERHENMATREDEGKGAGDDKGAENEGVVVGEDKQDEGDEEEAALNRNSEISTS